MQLGMIGSGRMGGNMGHRRPLGAIAMKTSPLAGKPAPPGLSWSTFRDS